MDSYAEEIWQQRQQRERELLGDRSWFTLAGLYWLHEGNNTFGSGSTNDIILPNAAAPVHAGRFTLENGVVALHVAQGVAITNNDRPVTQAILQPDIAPVPDFVALGPLTMVVLARGTRFGVRLYDVTNPARDRFSGLQWYPVQEALRIPARFIPYDPPKAISITNVLGDTNGGTSPGYVQFSWEGNAYRLDAEGRGEKLFFNFRDQTNGDTTYGAGRFLYADLDASREVSLDFNQATNPYCAYTPYATCPLPSADNHLPIRIEAGEMAY